ncbi:hypothetical protein O181_004216 [Austropuccinia psidii MF-1]|uniref:Reverse transcriptase RNase H-like domain-containing protein n=1 Tax=Austropuccinia psidii MF-1 TaxID=1389203 RepID=A0A9Q3GET9_9BASI|nr:hypothetical protein [Austropuccinia psidii MF-1]
MKEGRHVLLYIADIRILFSRIENWGEGALIHHFRKGLASKILDQLAAHPSRVDSLEDLMKITLELDTRYHERRKEMIHFQGNPEDSKDQVFTEIEDVGEVNSVSSLNLFLGNVDLPPSSYHDSLEELWDEAEETEEIETVMKFFPSAYHHYLDVFSKVKAEKRSPHCPCDRHIEWEGSLPPVGVICSLATQDSDTLREFREIFHPDTEASYYAFGAVMSQVSYSGKHPIEFDSHKLLPEGLNYEIHDKELYGIVCDLQFWRAFLLSLSSSFEILTNHSSLQYFISSKILTCHKTHWA